MSDVADDNVPAENHFCGRCGGAVPTCCLHYRIALESWLVLCDRTLLFHRHDSSRGNKSFFVEGKARPLSETTCERKFPLNTNYFSMFSAMFWFPRPRHRQAFPDSLEHDNEQRKATKMAASERNSFTAPVVTNQLPSSPNERAVVRSNPPPDPVETEEDGTFPQQTPVAQYSLQGSLVWDIGLRTYVWLAGYGILRLYGGVSGSVKEKEEGDGV